MKKKKKKELSFWQTMKNDWFAIKLGFSSAKWLVINLVIVGITGYLEWVFFDAYFMRTIVDALDSGKSFQYILTYILICGAFFMVSNLHYQYVENVVIPIDTTKLYAGIYKRIFKKARNVELRCYENPEFYNRYTMAMDGAEQKVLDIVRGFFGSIFGAISVGVVFKVMFEIDPFAVVFIICPLLGNFVFGNIKRKLEYKRYKEQVPNNKVLNYVNRAMYLPDYAKEMRLSNIFNLLKSQYHEATEKNVKAAKKYAFSNAHVNFWRITFTFTIIFEGVLFYSIYRHTVTGSITLAELAVMSSVMVAMTWILIGLFDNILLVIKNGTFINNLRTFLDYEEKIPEDQDGILPGAFESLEFRNVSFAYERNEESDESTEESEKVEVKETIRDLSFTLKKGEIAALVGHNGAGKTTIIKLLLRLYDPTKGEILLNGINIKEYNLHAYRALFATTFQDFSIMGMTVRENVLMGRKPENAEDVVVKALKRAGVYEKIMTLPQGIDSMMTKEFDEDGAVFSGGESQKLAVARTFAMDSPVKIFDEPSSALDPIAEYDLFKNIMKEGKNHTMLFISHRLSSVKSCDKVFMLEMGKLIEEGSHKELLEKNGSYAFMYKTQACNYLAISEAEGLQ